MTEENAQEPQPPAFALTGPAEEFTVGEDLHSQPCFLCNDAPLILGERAVKTPTTYGEKFQHAVCFYSVRASGLEEQLQQARALALKSHQLLCAALASYGGRINITKAHFREAERAKYQLERETTDDGTVRLRLKTGDVVVAKNIPFQKGSR